MKKFDWDLIRAQLPGRIGTALPGSAAHHRMLPAFRPGAALIPGPDARESGVLLLLYPLADKGTGLVLIQRSEDGGMHSGQIALPGGKREQEDKDIVQTALREAEEEVGLDTSSVEIVGLLSPLFINVSNFVVQPVIAFASQRPELVRSDHEVSRVLYTDIGYLFASRTEEKVQVRSLGDNMFWKAPVYKLEDDSVVWGATAMILSELEVICDTLK